MKSDLPVILLAFANEQQDATAYLRNLPRELNGLRDALEIASDKDLCEVEVLSNTTWDQLFRTFQKPKFKDRVAIFHFGGHAGSMELFLEEEGRESKKIHGEGLIPFLGKQNSLQLVFMNGCYTATLAEGLLKAGVPAVIGTIQAVDDNVATQLATAFYEGIRRGLGIGDAWEEATLKVVSAHGARDLSPYYQEKIDEAKRYIGRKVESDRFPWELRIKEGAEEVKNWNLPAASGNSLFGLPPIPDAYKPPADPFKFLARYNKEDAHIFFGRSEYIRELYQRVRSEHAADVILFYGQSGVGKSSLLEAGLLPRLEQEFQVKLIRRTAEHGLLNDLESLLQNTSSDEKPAVFILDQVEEVFTRPNEDDPHELDHFTNRLEQLFNNPGKKPPGKLILSYRKEYDPEIEDRLKRSRIYYEKVFVNRLGKQGIVEIVNGLVSTEQLRRKYRLDIEEELPEEIANNLLSDPDSPVGPVLQIILTKLWMNTANEAERRFRVADYRKLKSEGILLSDFFEQQLTQIRAWEAEIQNEVERSGLTLDLLEYHTSKVGTATSRTLEDLRRTYQHQAEILDDLILKLKELYLLSNVDQERTSLTHDTLAPIVRREMADSDRPGQRARRILESKIIGFKEDHEETFLDETDLVLVEQGHKGMRFWMPKERVLIDRSRARKEKLLRERRRNRTLLRGASAVVILLLGVAIYSGWQYSISQKKTKSNAIYNEGFLLAELNPTKATKLMLRGFQMDPSDFGKLAGAHKVYYENLTYDQIIKETNGYLNAVAFSPDGQFAATAIDADRAVRVYEISSGDLMHVLRGPKNPIYTLTFSGNNLLFAGSADRRAYVWDVATGQKKVFTAPPTLDSSSVMIVAASSDGTFLATGHADPYVRLWNVESGAFLREIPLSESPSAIAFPSKSNSVLVGAGAELTQFDYDGNINLSLNLGENDITALAVSQNKNWLAVGMEDGSLQIWLEDSIESQLLDTVFAHAETITCLAFSADDQFLLSASEDGEGKVWEMPQARLIHSLKGHGGPLAGIRFHPSQSTIFSASTDSTLFSWNFTNPFPFASLQAGEFRLESVDFSPDGKFLTAGGLDRKIYLWSKDRYSLLGTYEGHEASVQSIAIASDNETVASGDKEGMIHIWNRTSLAITHKQAVHENAILDLAFLQREGRPALFSCAKDGLIIRWNYQEQGMDTIHFSGHNYEVMSVALSPGGDHLLSCSLDSSAILWNVQIGSPIERIELQGPGKSIAFAGDNEWLIHGKQLTRRTRGAQPIILPSLDRQVVWSSDGSRYASVGYDQNSIELRTHHGYLIQRFSYPTAGGPSGDIISIALHPSGRLIAATTDRGEVLLWKDSRPIMLGVK